MRSAKGTGTGAVCLAVELDGHGAGWIALSCEPQLSHPFGFGELHGALAGLRPQFSQFIQCLLESGCLVFHFKLQHLPPNINSLAACSPQSTSGNEASERRCNPKGSRVLRDGTHAMCASGILWLEAVSPLKRLEATSERDSIVSEYALPVFTVASDHKCG